MLPLTKFVERAMRVKKFLAALMLTVPAPIWAQPKTFQPGEVIRADEINANFQEIYNLALGNSGFGAAEGGAPGLLWLGSGKLTAILPPDQSLLGVSCPNESQVSNRSVGQIHFIPGVCSGNCNIQTLAESCAQTVAFKAGEPATGFPANSDGSPTKRQPFATVTTYSASESVVCQKLTGVISAGELCDTNDTDTWRVLARGVNRVSTGTVAEGGLEEHSSGAIVLKVRSSSEQYGNYVEKQSFSINGANLLLPDSFKVSFQLDLTYGTSDSPVFCGHSYNGAGDPVLCDYAFSTQGQMGEGSSSAGTTTSIGTATTTGTD